MDRTKDYIGNPVKYLTLESFFPTKFGIEEWMFSDLAYMLHFGCKTEKTFSVLQQKRNILIESLNLP